VSGLVGLAVGPKRGRKTVERRNLTKQKIGLAVGAASEIDTGTGTENALLPRELHSLCLNRVIWESFIVEFTVK
jgi:hypothetical protein